MLTRHVPRSITLFSLLFLLALLPFVQGAHAQDDSITTIFASNNAFAGNMFDLTPLQTLTITAFDINIDVGNADISIYYKPGTYIGFENDASAWTLLGTDSVTSVGADIPTRVSIGGLTIPAGQPYGFYVDVTSYPSVSMLYTDGNNTYSNADIILTLGNGRGNPAFAGAIFLSRTWNGTIYYTLSEVGGEVPPPLLPPPPAPSGCRLVVPEGSVVGDAPFETQVYYEPGNVSPGVFLNPGTYIVTGQDESETYYRIMLACQFVWVRKETMQPSYEPPQNGAPLSPQIVGGSISTDGGGSLDSDS